MNTEAKLWPLEGEQGFKAIWPSELDFDPIWPIFKLDRDIVKMIILGKFDDDWSKTVASRVFTRQRSMHDARQRPVTINYQLNTHTHIHTQKKTPQKTKKLLNAQQMISSVSLSVQFARRLHCPLVVPTEPWQSKERKQTAAIGLLSRTRWSKSNVVRKSDHTSILETRLHYYH